MKTNSSKSAPRTTQLTPRVYAQIGCWLKSTYSADELRTWAQQHASMQISLNGIVGIGGEHSDMMAWIGDAIQSALTDAVVDEVYVEAAATSLTSSDK